MGVGVVVVVVTVVIGRLGGFESFDSRADTFIVSWQIGGGSEHSVEMDVVRVLVASESEERGREESSSGLVTRWIGANPTGTLPFSSQLPVTPQYFTLCHLDLAADVDVESSIDNELKGTYDAHLANEAAACTKQETPVQTPTLSCTRLRFLSCHLD